MKQLSGPPLCMCRVCAKRSLRWRMIARACVKALHWPASLFDDRHYLPARGSELLPRQPSVALTCCLVYGVLQQCGCLCLSVLRRHLEALERRGAGWNIIMRTAAPPFCGSFRSLSGAGEWSATLIGCLRHQSDAP